MITGKMLIDGVDIKSTYGAYIVAGGYDDVPSFSDMKAPEKNEWFEGNSVEIDLSSPCVESQKMSFRFMMNGGIDNVQSFVDFLMSKRTHTIEMVDVARTRSLRIVDVSASSISSICTIMVNMYDDDPREGLENVEPWSSHKDTGLSIDGVDVSKYGCLLTGSIDGLFPDIRMKENKLEESDYIDGQEHSTKSGVYVEIGDVRFRMIMRSYDKSDFWKKRDALFLNLTKEGERTISWKGRNTKVYYKSCNSIDFDYDNRCWWEFELTFGCIGE